jgi:hypothetical protein
MSPDPRWQGRRRREIRLCSEIGPDLVPGCFKDLCAELPSGAPPIVTLDNARQYWRSTENNFQRTSHVNSDRTETQTVPSLPLPPTLQECCDDPAAPRIRSPCPFQPIAQGAVDYIAAETSMEEEEVEEFSMGPGDPGRHAHVLRR